MFTIVHFGAMPQFRVPAKAIVLASAATALLSACGGGGDDAGTTVAPPSTPTVTSYTDSPSTIDASIDGSFGSNYAYVTTGTKVNKLFVFLSASGSTPSQYQLIQKLASTNGYYSIGLAYPNADVVALKCATSTDANCEGKIRQETLTGADVSTEVAVSTANSLENRLAKAISYLNAQHPADGWSQFLVGGAIQWNLIRIGGHSQGGGLAAYAATQHVVDRVCTFSSPADFRNGAPATWIAHGATPAASYFGFGHVQDQIVPWANLQRIWTAIGMTGPAVNVDAVATPYSSTQTLSTNLTAASGISYHGMPVADTQTPLTAAGVPVYQPVWQYACFR